MKALLVLVLCAALGTGCFTFVLHNRAERKHREAQIAECKRQRPYAPCRGGSSSSGTVVAAGLVGVMLDVAVVAGLGYLLLTSIEFPDD